MAANHILDALPEEVILNKIYLIRGHKVMLDNPDSYRDD